MHGEEQVLNETNISLRRFREAHLRREGQIRHLRRLQGLFRQDTDRLQSVPFAGAPLYIPLATGSSGSLSFAPIPQR